MIQRKSLRLKDYDYSTNGMYYITICTQNKECTLGQVVGCPQGELPKGQERVPWGIGRPHVVLTSTGAIVHDAILGISTQYPQATCDQFVIMPNHIHFLIAIHNADPCGRPMGAPTLSRIVNQMKGYASKRAGYKIWQKGYYESIIRSHDALENTWNYIEGNPCRWAEDPYYPAPLTL